MADKEPGRRLVVGVGSALMDILVRESDRFLDRTGAARGGMLLVEKEAIERILADVSRSPEIVPGGSACNTAVGIGRLGGRARFLGTRGSGEMGRALFDDLIRSNVEPMLFESETSTGRVLSIITPDAQRSMFTYLGAAAETDPAAVTVDCFEGAAVVHVEGYLLFNPELIRSVLAAAQGAGARVSLDLASFTVVEESRDVLEEIVDDYVDILIANEDEAAAFTGMRDEDRALEDLAARSEIAVLKLGPRGSRVARGGRTTVIAARGDGRAVDTTGAGDLWAAGFLFGLVNGLEIEDCGRIASACGYEVCQVVGASIPDVGWERIRRLL